MKNCRGRGGKHRVNCFCGKEIKDSENFLLQCQRYKSFRRIFLDNISSFVDFDIQALSSSNLCNLLLYGGSGLNLRASHIILESTLHFLNQTKHFNLFDMGGGIMAPKMFLIIVLKRLGGGN